MAQHVDLNKKVYSKNQYPKVIDTSFRELGNTTLQQDLQEQITVDQFFVLYDELFYDIPTEGDTNSHLMLVRQSGEYINYEETNEEIEALQAEITTLREQLLETQQQLRDTVISGSTT